MEVKIEKEKVEEKIKVEERKKRQMKEEMENGKKIK